MYLKNQLIVFAFLIFLALSITPLQKNNQLTKAQTSSSHPSLSATSKANTKKDVKATEVAKTVGSEAKNLKK